MKRSFHLKELGEDKFEIVAPSVSILAEPPVAIVDEVVDKKGTREVAKAYLEFYTRKKAKNLLHKTITVHEMKK